MDNEIKVNSELLMESVLDLDMNIGSITCMVENLEGMYALLSDLNEGMTTIHSPYAEGFQIRIQAILNLLSYSYKDLDKTVDAMSKNYNTLHQLIIKEK
ncbi:hypothetical protein H9650_14270 [Psychrobacillus sp. Sa2BUA9]|uniref:Uncharacterized protein n=1 Tax=Psychrobacillus faecigallinarum TaxID=2762235 RepID=A0ABR8RBV8_9BACI|nr:hypothetical protein [Psychrobacillus faecigallinarum]MBD7945288.1 hypothetical protein [Psychrobacillus faecigallinarum]